MFYRCEEINVKTSIMIKFDLVAFLFGGQASTFSRIVYTLVGVAAIWCITLLFRDLRDRDHT